MADVFVSHASGDVEFAQWITNEMRSHGVSAFMAHSDLPAGATWSREIISQVRQCRWVVVLASASACRSAWVLGELGVAIGAGKKVIPVVWDMDPRQLPAWMGAYKALDLRRAGVQEIRNQLRALAGGLLEETNKETVILGALVFGLLWLASRD